MWISSFIYCYTWPEKAFLPYTVSGWNLHERVKDISENPSFFFKLLSDNLSRKWHVHEVIHNISGEDKRIRTSYEKHWSLSNTHCFMVARFGVPPQASKWLLAMSLNTETTDCSKHCLEHNTLLGSQRLTLMNLKLSWESSYHCLDIMYFGVHKNTETWRLFATDLMLMRIENKNK